METIEISSVNSDLNDVTGESTVGSMTDKHKKRLRVLFDKLHQNITIERIILHMYSTGGIGDFEMNDLTNLCGAGKQMEASTKFLLEIPKGGFKSYFLFCESLIFTQRVWLCHELLEEDQEWDTLNRVRKERHQKDNQMASYFEIPKKITEEQFTELQRKQKAQIKFHVHENVFLNQTTPKQVVRTSGLSAHWSERSELETSLKRLETGPATFSAVEESVGTYETVPKQIDESPNSQPHEEGKEDSIVADFAEGDCGLPEWVRQLRKYQLELAEPGINGLNYIINAPTGSGKTWTAAYIIRDHLQKVGKSARVVFFCPMRKLVEQQSKVLEERFPEHDVDYLIGEEVHKKSTIEVMIRFNHIVVVTPDIINNALEKGSLTLDKFSLMIFDECHHADRDHPYNKVMTKYIDIKINDNERYQRLPQVIGMTASLGVGQARAGDEAVQFVLQKCANMDASEIKTVIKNTEELADKANAPFEETVSLQERPDDPFQKKILTSMKQIEDRIKSTLAGGSSSIRTFLELPEKKHTQIYRVMLSEIKQRLDDVPDSAARLIVLPCLEYLMAYYWALNTHREVRPKDAVVILQRKVKNRPRGTADEKNKPEIEKWLENIYLESLAELKILSKDPTLVNPRLEKMKEYILEYFENNKDTYGILFTETRLSTEALKSWINEDPELKRYNADRITGHTSEENYGITDKKQESVLQSFKDGEHRILIATSVAEEGLDIKACNLVIRYNYSTNEVGRVQTKGRARQKDSTMANFVSDDHKQDVKGKEKLNFFREGLMRSAVRSVQQRTKESYMKTIQQFQLHDAKDRQFKMLLKEMQAKSKSTERLLVVCFGCGTPMCYSNEIVTFDSGTKHICINPEFDKMIKIELHKKAGKHIDEFKKGHKVFCKNPECLYDMGVVFTYKEMVSFPVVKADAFRFFSINSNGEKAGAFGRFKKWEKTPVQYSEITEDDLLTLFEGKVYEVDDDRNKSADNVAKLTKE